MHKQEGALSLIHIYFVFDPVRYTLVGDESGKVYRLGQRVAVTLKSADATRCV